MHPIWTKQWEDRRRIYHILWGPQLLWLQSTIPLLQNFSCPWVPRCWCHQNEEKRNGVFPYFLLVIGRLLTHSEWELETFSQNSACTDDQDDQFWVLCSLQCRKRGYLMACETRLLQSACYPFLLSPQVAGPCTQIAGICRLYSWKIGWSVLIPSYPEP